MPLYLPTLEGVEPLYCCAALTVSLTFFVYEMETIHLPKEDSGDQMTTAEYPGQVLTLVGANYSSSCHCYYFYIFYIKYVYIYIYNNIKIYCLSAERQ